jgi:hypothetical protein
MRQRQLLSLGGLASVVLLLAAFAVSGDAPGTGESGAAIRAFYVDHGTDQQISAFLLMIVVPFLIVFAATVRATLVESGEDRSAIWPNVFFAGSVVTGAGLLFTACLQLALADAPEKIGGSALQALNVLASDNWPAFTGGIGVMLLGAAGAMIPLRGGLRWLGWTALVLGIVIFTPIGFIGFAGAGVWVICTSVAMALRLRRPRANLAAPLPSA